MNNGRFPIFIKQPRAVRMTVKATDGQVYVGILGNEIRKVLEKPAGFARPVVVYECQHPVSKLIVRLWPDQVEFVDGEPIE